MAKNLLIVESPAKAKTINKYLGSDFEVKSSFGHIRDLPKKDTGVDIANNFEPTYITSPDKKKVAAELKAAAKGKTVWLASDPDREGEAIAWHLAQLLKLDPTKTNRIVFREITESGIKEAVAKPRTVDIPLFEAQQARRILDRLVGYELSPVLWKKVRRGLSAGRVQSVAVRLIVEREREIRAHEAKSQYRVLAIFTAGKEEVPAELSTKFDSVESAKKFLEDCLSAEFKINKIDQKPGTKSSGAPFTTSTLQQEANRKLGYSVKQTMTLAQRLYENGHITYMRTDSTNLSQTAIDAMASYIRSTFGENYLDAKVFKTKNASAQEAHEAIRPTNFNLTNAGDDAQQKKLYELIWRRALASQMAKARVQKTEISISISTRKEVFIAKGEVLEFDGYLKVYGGGKDDVILPAVNVGDKLDNQNITATEGFSRSAARYNEAALVKKLEELGIGRPSTYAPTISTIQDRGYIEKQDIEGVEKQITELVMESGKITENQKTIMSGADRAKLIPMPVAEITTDFLVKYFADILDYDFTAEIEKEFDDIAEGKLEWHKMLRNFYGNFHKLIEGSANISREETSQSRVLGKDPKSGKPISVRFARFGPVLQLGESPDPKDKEAPKPRFAPLPTGATMDNISLEQALPMFDLPRVVGKTKNGDEIQANIGRFGPYIQIGKLYVSIKPLEPQTITEAEANELYEAKLKIEAERNIADFGTIKVLNGRYGPYITNGKVNVKIPKDQDPKQLTEAECKDLIKNAPPKRKRFTKKSK